MSAGRIPVVPGVEHHQGAGQGLPPEGLTPPHSVPFSHRARPRRRRPGTSGGWHWAGGAADSLTGCGAGPHAGDWRVWDFQRTGRSCLRAPHIARAWHRGMHPRQWCHLCANALVKRDLPRREHRLPRGAGPCSRCSPCRTGSAVSHVGRCRMRKGFSPETVKSKAASCL